MNNAAENTLFASVPMQWVGPALLKGSEASGEIMIPLATYESPLWPSVNRGARVTVACGGLEVSIADERMTRSILLEAQNGAKAIQAAHAIKSRQMELAGVAATTSRFAQLIDIHTQIAGNLLFIRLELLTGDASGHNMCTKAADAIIDHLLKSFPDLSYGSISGNYCCDKKASAVNGILGRGKYVVADAVLPRKVVARFLKTTPEKIIDLNIKKNLIGTMLAGGLRSANAHFANMLLGFYLATGQDAANIIEGSQGFVQAELRGEDLYFSCTLPNVIVGSVGNGKDLAFVQKNMELLGCTEPREPGQNARRLAAIAVASVWCGELSLLAAQTNPGELMRAHLRLERK